MKWEKKNLVMSILLVVVLLVLFVVPVAAQGVVPDDAVEPTPDMQLKTIMGTLLVIGALAFLLETLIEALIGRPLEHFPKLKPYKKDILVYSAVIVGIIGAFIYKFDVLYLLGSFAESPIPSTSYGISITGVAIGMGASYFHQFVSKFFPPANGAQG